MRSKLSGRGLAARTKSILSQKLLDGFEEEPEAEVANCVNEKALNRMMNKIVKAAAKRSKPIDTRVLVSRSKR